jgi:hypothetical protein
MAARFKMVTKTEFSYVEKKLLFTLKLLASSIMWYLIDFGLEINNKYISKIQNQKWQLNSR